MPGPVDIRSAAVVDAAEHLYGLPLASFVAERKRRATELRAGGDKAGAKAVAELGRPTLSAWVVNQLYRLAPDELAALFAAADRMKRGDRAASDDHRQAGSRLRARAAQILVGDGHAASESTLRRVTTTLLALAAHGSFEPDAAGQLVADRDPPGFEAMEGLAATGPVAASGSARPVLRLVSDEDDAVNAVGDAEAARAESRRRAAAAAAEVRSRAIARATTELASLERQAGEARRQFESADREVAELRERLQRFEDQRDQAGARAAEVDDAVTAARRRLTALSEANDETE